MIRYATVIFVALLGTVFATTLPAQKPPANDSTQKRPAGPGNILLITVDSLRADRLDPYIGKSDLTPAIGALAERGVMFSRAYAASPSTAPSNATILTGYYPGRHGLRHDLGGYLDDGIPTLAERLRNAGYATGAVIGSFHLDSDRHLDRGFDTYDDDIEGIAWRFATLSKERRAEEVVDGGLRFIDQVESGKPWFLWLNFYDPHFNYGPIEGIHAEFDAEAYAAEVAQVDAQVARLEESLRSRQLLGRTDIVLAGSHGEGLGDHGETGHGVYLYEQTIRVPLIIVKAGKEAARGVEVAAPVSLADIAPTVMTLAGADPDDSFDGRSLAGMLVPGDGSTRHAASSERRLFVESVHPREAYGWSPLYAVVQGNRKIVQGRWLEAFDLRSDAGERKPIDPAPGWAAPLVAFGRERLGDLEPPERVRKAILKDVRALDLPWDNSPICLEKQDWPDPRDPERKKLHGSLFAARVNYDQKAVGLSFSAGYELVENDPANFTALEMVIFLFVRNGAKDMVPDYLEILQCNYPYRATPYHYYGHFLDKAERLKEAEQAYRLMSRIDPLLEDGPYDMATIYARTGRVDEAFAELERAIEMGATDYEFMLTDVRLVPLREDPRFDSLVPVP